ncbi:hypothetical protein LOK49_Contig319G00007 [Camellia lanceoleosa]|nr:hypothetical protein LOK49_Contig319G00007 [Camellia lanceoleosa]
MMLVEIGTMSGSHNKEESMELKSIGDQILCNFVLIDCTIHQRMSQVNCIYRISREEDRISWPYVAFCWKTLNIDIDYKLIVIVSYL